MVIGGGIAGLTAAYNLKKAGVEVTLIERDSSVGGAIKTVLKHESYLLELGPNTFLSSSDKIFNLSQELSISRKLIANENASKKRYVFRKDSLEEVPVGPKAFLRSPILSFSGKVRTLMEPFVRSRSDGCESMAAFVKRRAGKELLETLVDPFVSGVYAGDPYQLEMKSVFPRLVEIERECGSIFKGMKKLKGQMGESNLLSYYWGMQTLPARIADLLGNAVRVHTNVEGVERLPDGRWTAYLDHSEALEADAVVIATHADEAARLLVNSSRDIFEPLMAIRYVSLAVVHTAHKRGDIPAAMDGFGFLIPRREKVRMLGTIWSSTLFPNRAPQGETLMTNFIGGATDPFAIDLDDHEIFTHISLGLEQTMGIRCEPRFCHITRINQAIPQYTVGHQERVEKISNCLKRMPGVFLTGSYFTGISVTDTIAHAERVANSVVARLNRTA